MRRGGKRRTANTELSWTRIQILGLLTAERTNIAVGGKRKEKGKRHRQRARKTRGRESRGKEDSKNRTALKKYTNTGIVNCGEDGHCSQRKRQGGKRQKKERHKQGARKRAKVGKGGMQKIELSWAPRQILRLRTAERADIAVGGRGRERSAKKKKKKIQTESWKRAGVRGGRWEKKDCKNRTELTT